MKCVKSFAVLALAAVVTLSLGSSVLWAADTPSPEAKKLSKAANAKSVKKAKVLANKKSVKKMESDAKKKKGRGYGADEDLAFAMCGLTAEIGAQVMIDASKGTPVSATIENVKAGEIYRAIPAELSGDAEFNKNLELAVTEMHKEFAGNAEYREQVKDMSPEELKLGLFMACMVK